MHSFRIFKFFLFLLSFLFILVSCEKDDEGFHQISQIETRIHNLINEYRTLKGLNNLVLQPLMFKEARIHSDRMANGLIEVGDETIDERFASVKEKIGGTAEGWVILSSNVTVADSIVEKMISEKTTADIIEQEYTQSGVGVSYDKNGTAYVTHMYLLIPDK